jgi:hypothetical protein
MAHTLCDQFGIYADISNLQAIYPKDFMSFEVGLKKMIKKILE